MVFLKKRGINYCSNVLLMNFKDMCHDSLILGYSQDRVKIENTLTHTLESVQVLHFTYSLL